MSQNNNLPNISRSQYPKTKTLESILKGQNKISQFKFTTKQNDIEKSNISFLKNEKLETKQDQYYSSPLLTKSQLTEVDQVSREGRNDFYSQMLNENPYNYSQYYDVNNQEYNKKLSDIQVNFIGIKNKDRMKQFLSESCAYSHQLSTHTQRPKRVNVLTQRQDVIKLAQWLDYQMQQILGNKQIYEHQKLSEIETVFNLSLKELVREISLDCVEKSVLLEKIWNQYTQYNNYLLQSIDDEKNNQENEYLAQIKSLHQTYQNSVKFLEQKLKMIDEEFNKQNIKLEKKKFKLQTFKSTCQKISEKKQELDLELELLKNERIDLLVEKEKLHQEIFLLTEDNDKLQIEVVNKTQQLKKAKTKIFSNININEGTIAQNTKCTDTLDINKFITFNRDIFTQTLSYQEKYFSSTTQTQNKLLYAISTQTDEKLQDSNNLKYNQYEYQLNQKSNKNIYDEKLELESKLQLADQYIKELQKQKNLLSNQIEINQQKIINSDSIIFNQQKEIEKLQNDLNQYLQSQMIQSRQQKRTIIGIDDNCDQISLGPMRESQKTPSNIYDKQNKEQSEKNSMLFQICFSKNPSQQQIELPNSKSPYNKLSTDQSAILQSKYQNTPQSYGNFNQQNQFHQNINNNYNNNNNNNSNNNNNNNNNKLNNNINNNNIQQTNRNSKQQNMNKTSTSQSPQKQQQQQQQNHQNIKNDKQNKNDYQQNKNQMNQSNYNKNMDQSIKQNYQKQQMQNNIQYNQSPQKNKQKQTSYQVSSKTSSDLQQQFLQLEQNSLKTSTINTPQVSIQKLDNIEKDIPNSQQVRNTLLSLNEIDNDNEGDDYILFEEQNNLDNIGQNTKRSELQRQGTKIMSFKFNLAQSISQGLMEQGKDQKKINIQSQQNQIIKEIKEKDSPYAEQALEFMKQFNLSLELQQNEQIETVMQLQSVLKQITQFYKEKINRQQQLYIICYEFYMNSFGLKQIAENKLTSFYLSLIQYKNIPRIQLFSRFLHLFDAIDDKDLIFYFQILSQIDDQQKLEYFLTCQNNLDCILVSYEKAMNQISQLKEQIYEVEQKLKTKIQIINGIGLIDIDLFFLEALEQFQLMKKIHQDNFQSLFEAVDVNDDEQISLEEFLVLVELLEGNNNIIKQKQLFIKECGNSDGLTFYQFGMFCLRNSLFTKEIQEKFIQFNENSLEQLKVEWNQKRKKVTAKLKQSGQFTDYYQDLVRKLDNALKTNKTYTWMLWRILEDKSESLLIESYVDKLIIKEFNNINQCCNNFI